MKIQYLFVACCLVTATPIHAQFKGGVRIGLNFSNIQGPSALTDAGAVLDKYENNTGFLIGPTFSYVFTDHFGLRGELMYSRRGAKYTYEGDMFRRFTLDNNQGTRVVNGIGKQLLVINNSYVDIPLGGYARFKDFEISGGVYASFLFQSVADGSLQFEWANQDNTKGNLELNQKHNYRRDKPGEGYTEDPNTVTVQVNSRAATLPATLGAYYEETDDRGNLYQSLDYGLQGGLSYYVSRSLFIGVRLQYGLTDLSRNEADRSKYRPADAATGSNSYRDDFDRNFTIQGTVGFSF